MVGVCIALVVLLLIGWFQELCTLRVCRKFDYGRMPYSSNTDHELGLSLGLLQLIDAIRRHGLVVILGEFSGMKMYV
jgi:hypothetical protein